MRKGIKYRRSRTERYKEKIRAYTKERRGMFGLFMLIFFGVMGIFIPFLAETGVLPPPSGIDSYVTSDYLPPRWIEIFPKNLIPGSGNIVPDTKFEENNTWSFNTSDSFHMNFNYDSEEKITGRRSIRFSFVDNSSTLSYQGNIQGNLIFPWPFIPPTNASLTFYMKVKVTGNLSMSSFSPYVRLNLPKDTDIPPQATNFALLPPQHSEWMQYKRYLTFIHLLYIFQPNSTINLEIGIDFRYMNPTLIGEISIWFDKIELYVTRPTYGLMGSNHQGQDIFVRLCYSVQASFFVAFIAGTTSLVMGVIIGIIAGYRGGVLDTLIMRIVDLLLVYPSLLIVFLLMAQYEISFFLLPFLIAMFTWPSTARIIRSRVLTEREQLYIESAKASGANDWHIMFRIILPNILGLIFVQFTTNAANAINLEAGLSFLDYPYQSLSSLDLDRREKRLPKWLSWGFMLAEVHFEAGFHNQAWWTIIPPGICIVLMAASFMFVGNAFDRVFNPLKFQDRSFKYNFRNDQ
ncbi:MAG: ABC transporter permease [Candidatus Thorarchaeota archaeon]